MKCIPAAAAPKEIAETLARAKEYGRMVSILIGAGVSKAGGIPLAGELVEAIRTKYEARVEVAAIDPASENAYGQAMAALKVNERRDLLQPYFDQARVNWANIAIAQLVATGVIDRVLNVNFDPLLARACGLLQVYPAIYDYSAPPKIDQSGRLVEPAIIHLHGQSYGFKQLNTDKETSEHRAALTPLLRHSLSKGPLLIVGYSGGADVVFETIRDVYSNDDHIYWLGHSDMPREPVGQFLKDSGCCYVPGCDADYVLIELAHALKKWPPKLFTQPVDHLLDSPANLTPYPKNEANPNYDLLGSFQATLSRLKASEERLERDVRRANLIEQYYEKKYEEVWQRVTDLKSNGQADDELLDLGYWAAIGAGMNSLGAKNFSEAARYFERALTLKPKEHDALNNWGVALTEMARAAPTPEAAEALHRQAIDKYEAAIKIKPDAHDALNNWGVALAAMARAAPTPEAAEALRRQAIEKYEAALKIKPDKDNALQNQVGVLLDQFHACSDDGERARLLQVAEGTIERAEKLKPGSYNRACVAALKGNAPSCERYLRAAHARGQLPDRKHLQSDKDLAGMHGEPWWPEVLALATPG